MHRSSLWLALLCTEYISTVAYTQQHLETLHNYAGKWKFIYQYVQTQYIQNREGCK